jgi:hypothetical protein
VVFGDGRQPTESWLSLEGEVAVVTEAQAKLIYDKARGFYKGKPRSFNKRYSPWEEAGDPDGGALPRKIGKSELRLKGQGLMEQINELRDQYKGFFYKDAGQALALWYEGLPQEGIGNCQEMAIVAGHYAIEEIKGIGIWIGVQPDGEFGGHSWCLIGPKTKPVWHNLGEMERSGDGDSYVIDPWADTWCTPPAFKGLFIEKLKNWQKKGKKIWRNCAWRLAADVKYLKALGTEPIDWRDYLTQKVL